MVTNDPCEGPYPLVENIPEYYPAKQMCLAHNMFLRGLNAIYIQATSVSAPQDIADFMIYAQCWYEMVHHHHSIEEDYFFPEVEKLLNKPGLMSKDVEQHHSFLDALERFAKKSYEYSTETAKYDGTEWRRYIDEFAKQLVEHLHEEIDTMRSLEAMDKDSAIITELWPELDKRAQKASDMSRVYPYALSASDMTFLGGRYPFPELPFFVPYMVDWIYARKHRGAWRFSPCTMHSQPRPLQFVQSNR